MDYGYRYRINDIISTDFTFVPNNTGLVNGSAYYVYGHNTSYLYCKNSGCGTGDIAFANDTDEMFWQKENSTTVGNKPSYAFNSSAVAVWHMDSVNARDTIGANGCTWVTTAPTLIDGTIGKALRFAPNGYLDCGSNSSITAIGSGYTVAVCFNTSTGNQMLLDCRNSADLNGGWGISKVTDGGTEFQIFNGAVPSAKTTNKVQDYTIWHCAVARQNATHIDVMMDANLTGRASTAANAEGAGSLPLLIGRSARDGLYLNGSIDEVVIDKRVWSDAEAQAWMFNKLSYFNNASVLGQEEAPSVGPQYSNEAPKYASPASFDDSNTYGFQIEWNAASGYFNTSNVTFQANFSGFMINYTYATSTFVKNDSANTFYINFSQSQFTGAGDFQYRWFATNGTESVTGVYYYTISKASTTIYEAINGTQADATITYGAAVNVTGWKTVSGGTLGLERNGTSISNPYYAVLAAGSYEFNATLSHQNYTATDVTRYLTINKASGNITLTASPSWSVAANTQVTITATSNVSYILYKNGVIVGSPYVAVMSFGSYNFTAALVDDQNYTDATVTKWLTVAAGGFGCTNVNTFAFTKTIAGNGMKTLNFTDIYFAGLIKADLSDVWVNTSNMTVWRNQTGSNIYMVVNATNATSFVVNFGNYIGNQSWTDTTNTTGLMMNMTSMDEYSEANPYYVITFLEETTGAQQLPPGANHTLTLYCTNGAATFPLNSSKIIVASFEQLTEIKATVTYSATEIYYRNLIVRSSVEYNNYYLVDANMRQVAQMQISISDTTNAFGTGSVVKIKKTLEDTLQTITEGYLDAEVKIILYLINADRYQIYIDNGIEERNIGYLYVDPTDLTKTIVISEGLAGVNIAASNVSYSFNMTGKTIHFDYIDGAELTLNVSFWVYNYSDGSELYYASSTNRSRISFAYMVADENQTYQAKVRISREGYTLIDLVNLFTGTVSAITTVSPAYASIPSSYLIAFSLGLIVIIPMLFGGVFGAAAGVAMVLIAGALAYFGFLQISIVILILAGVFAVFNALTKRKVEA